MTRRRSSARRPHHARPAFEAGPVAGRPDAAHFVHFDAEQIEIQRGAAADKQRLMISSGGGRMAVQIDLDLFLSVVGELIRKIEPDPNVPDQLQ